MASALLFLSFWKGLCWHLFIQYFEFLLLTYKYSYQEQIHENKRYCYHVIREFQEKTQRIQILIEALQNWNIFYYHCVILIELERMKYFNWKLLKRSSKAELWVVLWGAIPTDCLIVNIRINIWARELEQKLLSVRRYFEP